MRSAIRYVTRTLMNERASPTNISGLFIPLSLHALRIFSVYSLVACLRKIQKIVRVVIDRLDSNSYKNEQVSAQ